jgi:hypothetical protein
MQADGIRHPVAAGTLPRTVSVAAPKRRERLERLDIRSLLALRTGDHFERDTLVLLERFEAVCLDCRKVGEKIFAAVVRSNESEALRVVKPFDSTSCHYFSHFVLLSLRPVDHLRNGKSPTIPVPKLDENGLYEAKSAEHRNFLMMQINN